MNKQYGLFLHISVTRDIGGFQELNASHDPSTWRIIPFTPYIYSNETEIICAGDALKIFHRESEKILVRKNTRASVVSHKLGNIKSFDVTNEEDIITLNSIDSNDSNSFWVIENIDEHLGGKLRYNAPVRFKHIATNEYLAVKQNKIVERSSSTSKSVSPNFEKKKNLQKTTFSLYTTSDTTPETIFTFESLHPQHQPDDFMRGGTQLWYILIKSKQHDLYIAPSFENKSGDGFPFEMKSEFQRDDANSFCLLTIEKGDLLNLYEVLGEIKKIDFYLSLISLPKTSNKRNMIPNAARNTTDILKIMINKCVDTNNQPNHQYQHILREQNFFTILIDVIKQTFHEELGISVKAINEPANFSLVNICKLAFQMMRNMLKGNANNR
jgi:hypothetical protein